LVSYSWCSRSTARTRGPRHSRWAATSPPPTGLPPPHRSLIRPSRSLEASPTRSPVSGSVTFRLSSFLRYLVPHLLLRRIVLFVGGPNWQARARRVSALKPFPN